LFYFSLTKDMQKWDMKIRYMNRKSEWSRTIKYYREEENCTYSEAFGKAFGDQLLSMGLDALAGAISGSVISGSLTLVNNAAQARADRAERKASVAALAADAKKEMARRAEIQPMEKETIASGVQDVSGITSTEARQGVVLPTAETAGQGIVLPTAANSGVKADIPGTEMSMAGQSASDADGRQFMLVGTTEDGRKIYKTNYPKGTPKAVKQNDVIQMVQNIWSKKPIELTIVNEETGETETITAKFDPELSERSDLAKIAYGNKKGTGSERRMTLDLAPDFYQIAQDAKHTGGKTETGKDNPAHNDVKRWEYFVTNLVYEDEHGTQTDAYMNIDVKRTSDGEFFYSFGIEKGTAPQTLLAAVGENASPTVPIDSIPQTASLSQGNTGGNIFDGNVLPTAQEAQEQMEREQRAAKAETETERTGILLGVSDEVIREAVSVSKALDVDVLFYRDIDGEVEGDLGYYNHNNGKIYLNADIKNPASFILGHEMIHHIQLTKGYLKFADAVLKKIQQDGGNLDAMRKNTAKRYKKKKVVLTSLAKIDQEIIAEYAQKHLFTNEADIISVVNADQETGHVIKRFLDNVLAKLGNENARERVFVQNARALYAKALRENVDIQERLYGKDAARAENTETSTASEESADMAEDEEATQTAERREVGDMAGVEAAVSQNLRPEITENAELMEMLRAQFGADGTAALVRQIQAEVERTGTVGRFGVLFSDGGRAVEEALGAGGVSNGGERQFAIGKEKGVENRDGVEYNKYNMPTRPLKPGDTFPPFNESRSDANERATRWAHREDVKNGDCVIVNYHGKKYTIVKDDNTYLRYTIVRKLTKKGYSNAKQYYGEVEQYDIDRDEQQRTEGILSDSKENREHNSNREGGSRNDSLLGADSRGSRDAEAIPGRTGERADGTGDTARSIEDQQDRGAVHPVGRGGRGRGRGLVEDENIQYAIAKDAEEALGADNVKNGGERQFSISKDEETEGIFSVPQEVTEKLSAQVDSWLQGGMRSDEHFDFGKTPEVLKQLGAQNLPIVMNQSVMAKITGGSHAIALDVIKEIPNAMAAPVMIFKSNTVKNAFVVITEFVDKEGMDVVIALHLNKFHNENRINRIASVYGKKNLQNFIETQSEIGNLKYIDKNKSQAWSIRRGLQLPKLNAILDSNNSILQKENVVNRYTIKNSGKYAQNEEKNDGIQYAIAKDTDKVEVATEESTNETNSLDFWDEWLEKVKEYGAMPKGEKPARDIAVPKKIAKNKPVSQTVESREVGEMTGVESAVSQNLRPEITENAELMQMLSDKFGADGTAALVRQIQAEVERTGTVGKFGVLFSDGGRAVEEALGANDDGRQYSIGKEKGVAKQGRKGYNKKQIKMNPQEYTLVKSAIMKKEGTRAEGVKPGVDSVYAYDKYYLYEPAPGYDGVVIARFDPIYDQKAINEIEEGLKNGTIRDKKALSGRIKDFRSGKRFGALHNGNDENGRTSDGAVRIYGSELGRNDIGHSGSGIRNQSGIGLEAEANERQYAIAKDAEEKETMAEGRKSSAQKIELGMDDKTRYEILKDKRLKVANYNAAKAVVVPEDLRLLETKYKKEAAPILKRLASDFGVVGTYENEDIDLEFVFSNGKLGESINKQKKSYQEFGKMLSVFKEVVENAIGIETHPDKYKGTIREDPQLKQTYVLVSAFREGENIYPVRLTVKEFKGNIQNSLHVAVCFEKIKDTISEQALRSQSESTSYPPVSSDISLAYLLENVKDEDLKKYIPEGFKTAGSFDNEDSGIQYAITKDAEEALGADNVKNGGERQFSISKDEGADTLREREKITVNMDEDARYEVLKDKKVTPQEVGSQGNADIDFEYLENNIKSVVEKGLLKKFQQMGLFKRYKSIAVGDISFDFTGKGFRKSLHSQETAYGGSKADFAKVLLNLENLLDASVLIETHTDKGKGTDKEKRGLEKVYVLFGALSEDGTITPVQFEVEQYKSNENRLYLAVALTKIETGVKGNTASKERKATSLLPVSDISIAEIFTKINPTDKNFLKYIPNQFLGAEQIAAKEKAFAKDKEKYSNKTNQRDDNIQYAITKDPTETETTTESAETTEGTDFWDEWLEKVKEYGAMPKGEKPARDIKVPKKIGKNKPVSQTVRTILEAKVTPDEAIPTIEQMVLDGDFSYDVHTDKKAIKDADGKIEKQGFVTAFGKWEKDMDAGKVSKENTALGWALYNQAATSGDIKTATTILNKMVQHQRNAAQALQATWEIERIDIKTKQTSICIAH